MQSCLGVKARERPWTGVRPKLGLENLVNVENINSFEKDKSLCLPFFLRTVSGRDEGGGRYGGTLEGMASCPWSVSRFQQERWGRGLSQHDWGHMWSPIPEESGSHHCPGRRRRRRKGEALSPLHRQKPGVQKTLVWRSSKKEKQTPEDCSLQKKPASRPFCAFGCFFFFPPGD